MQKLKLDDAVKSLSGADIMLSPGKPLTYRSALISACETYQGESGSGDTIRAYHLGGKIVGAKEDLTSFTKEEIAFLTKVVENNRAFMAVIVGRLTEFINNK